MKIIRKYLREVAGVKEEQTATLLPFLSERKQDDPLVLNLNKEAVNVNTTK